MKHIYLNLKRFDVPAELGGVNRIADMKDWGKYIVENTQEELKKYSPEDVEFAMFFPEIHLFSACQAKTENSPVQIGCQGVFRDDVAPGKNFGAFTTGRPAAAMKAAGCETVIIGHCEERNNLAGILAEAGVVNTKAVNTILNKEIKEVELTYKDQVTPVVTESVEYENIRQKVDLKIVKLDSETETPLKDAEFGLYAKEDIYGYKEAVPMSMEEEPLVKATTLIEKAVSDENGNVSFKTDLPLSLFEIKELKAPIGYASNDEVYEVDASYQGQDVETIKVTYEVLNEITKVEISKQDITTGKELAGAHMVIKKKDGSIFDSWGIYK